MKSASPYDTVLSLGDGAAWRPITMLLVQAVDLFGLGVKHDPHVAEWLIGRLGWDTIEDGHGVGRADRDGGVSADDGERDWRRRVLDASDLEGWVKSPLGGAP